MSGTPGVPPEEGLRELVESSLGAADPGRAAVRASGRVLSYGELAARSGELAAALAGGAGPVRIDRPRGIDALVAVVGCIRAGRPFFPLDPGSAVDPGAVEGLPPGCGYLLTTSGTAGAPKVVLGSARALARYLRWQRDELGLGGADVLSNTADPWFDFSFKETLGALVAGATIAVAGPAAVATGPALLGWLAQERPTTACLLPSRLAALVGAMERAGAERTAAATERLRWLLVSGEPFPVPLLRRWRALVPAPTVLNLYGPTESTVIKLRHVLPPGAALDTATVPVGHPIPGTRVELLPAAAGDAAELCLVTDDLALGYLHPAAGSTRFESGAGGRRLRTGDLARLGPGGAVELLGRIDDVVKRRGVKVSLPAVEAAALRVPLVDSAVAVVAAGGRIVLFCGVSAGPAAVPLRSLRTALLDRLDPSQLPDRIQFLAELPLDRRAKVDRAALRALAVPPAGR